MEWSYHIATSNIELCLFSNESIVKLNIDIQWFRNVSKMHLIWWLLDLMQPSIHFGYRATCQPTKLTSIERSNMDEKTSPKYQITKIVSIAIVKYLKMRFVIVVVFVCVSILFYCSLLFANELVWYAVHAAKRYDY